MFTNTDMSVIYTIENQIKRDNILVEKILSRKQLIYEFKLIINFTNACIYCDMITINNIENKIKNDNVKIEQMMTDEQESYYDSADELLNHFQTLKSRALKTTPEYVKYNSGFNRIHEGQQYNIDYNMIKNDIESITARYSKFTAKTPREDIIKIMCYINHITDLHMFTTDYYTGRVENRFSYLYIESYKHLNDNIEQVRLIKQGLMKLCDRLRIYLCKYPMYL